MKLLAVLVAVVTVCAVWGEEVEEVVTQETVEVKENESEVVDERFVLDVGQETEKYGEEDKEGDGDNESSSRKRRSVGLLSPSSYKLRGLGYRYRDVSPVGLGQVYGYDDFAPVAFGYRRPYGGNYYVQGGNPDRYSFVRFYNSFTPLRAVRNNRNVYVRNYVRHGSFDDCLSDFRRLRLQQVKVLSPQDVQSYDNDLVSLVSGVAQVSQAPNGLFASAERDSTVGYVGVMRDFPYQVYALRDGCQLDGYSGYHDCIVFTGATYPYSSTVRRFVYVREQAAVSTATNTVSAVDTVDRVVADRYVKGLGAYGYGVGSSYGSGYGSGYGLAGSGYYRGVGAVYGGLGGGFRAVKPVYGGGYGSGYRRYYW